jgi:hypothetical protein
MNEETPVEVLEQDQEMVEELPLDVEENTDTETEQEEPVESSEPQQDETEESKEQARRAYEARQQKRNSLKMENEHLKQQLEQIKAQSSNVNQDQQPMPQQHRDLREPLMENYDSVEDYLRARDKHRDIINYERSIEQKIQENFSNQMAEYSAKHKGFLDEVESSDVQLNNQVARVIRESRNAPKVLHEIVRDESLANRLNNLNSFDLMREIIALENKQDKKEPAISRAPTPIKTPTGSSVTPKFDMAEMTNAQYRDFMNNKKYKG